MKIFLSGYNLDIETLSELRHFVEQVYSLLSPDFRESKSEPERAKVLDQLYERAKELVLRENLTPETLSAAYARISRSPKPVNELREIARKEVDRARKSNQNIIFGLGHSSVAEHAVFNFDVIGVSRLAVEFIEHFRLASFTEKSQRYVLFRDEFVTPAELESTDLRQEYQSVVKSLFSAYHQLYEKLRPYVFEKYAHLASERKNHSMLEGLAKEDARYITPLATSTQLGMTLNARSLERMISKGAAHPLQEVRQFARTLYQASAHYAPSLIKYTEPTKYLLNKEEKLHRLLNVFTAPEISEEPAEEVRLLQVTPDADQHLLTTLFFRYTSLSFHRAQQMAKRLTPEDKKRIFREVFRHINPWDAVLREFETVQMTFELVVSASSYAQFKRHRMATIIPQNYNLSLGTTIPPAIREVGMEAFFLEHIEQAEKLYRKLQQSNPVIAPYILTNAHRRRILFQLNLREFYHFLRLREDEHAQWDIRQTAEQMHRTVSRHLPLTGALLAGKHRFVESYRKFFQS